MVYEGKGEAEPPALPTRDHSEGAGLLILHLPQAIYILHIALHFKHLHAITQTKRLRKEFKYMLIHNIPFKALSDALKTHVSHFEN